MAAPKPSKKAILDDKPLIDEDVNKADMDGDGDDDGDDGDDEDDDDEDDGEGAYGKSEIAAVDLLKALDEMDSITKSMSNGIHPRQRALAAKLANGDTLSKSEQAELTSLMKGSTTTSTKESFMKDEGLKGGFEVSDFLDALGTRVAEAIDGLNDGIAKSMSEQGEFNQSLAKSFNSLGRLVLEQQKVIEKLAKKLAKSEGAQEREPAQPQGRPSAVGTKVNENKGRSRQTDDKGGSEVFLSKADIANTIDTLIEKSEGKLGKVDGIDLTFELTKFESTQSLSPQVARLVAKERGIDPKVFGLTAA